MFRSRTTTRVSSAEKAQINRIHAFVLAIIGLCIVVLLFWSAFHNGRPVGWQIRLISSFGESFYDFVGYLYDRAEA